MKKFKDKVAVITGAASGIGLALVNKCVQEGMKVVLADIDEKQLRRGERRLKRKEADITTVRTDVSRLEDIENLAKKTLETYGAVHLLVNNAGFGNTKYTWEYTIKDWEWQLGVLLWGVIYAIRIFTPIMLKQNDDCHIVNVSSMEGLVKGSGPGGCIYGTSKHGVVSLSETFHTDLELKGISNLKVSVVCPGFVKTNIFFGDRNRPKDFENPVEQQVESTRGEKFFAKFSTTFEAVLEQTSLMEPDEAADRIFQGIKNEDFYILTHKDELMKRMVRERFDEILKAFE
ncbi:MAG: SDR family NAD(P)-dependent oxidoreductase [Promethearchaeota archaeon]